MVSTRTLATFPDIPTLRQLTRSLAMLDAIMSPEWESRYFSFDSHWGVGEEMRNGQGADENGSAPLLEIFDGRPETYRAFAADYSEVDLRLDAVASVYAHRPLTPGLIARLNAETSLDTLGEDIAEIGYPEPRTAA